MTLGMVLGKFMPPHTGHVYLCEVAQRMCDELVIVVASRASEPIDGARRVAWMTELLPHARILHLTAELPQEPAEHPDFWALWRTHLLGVLPRAPDRVFTSDRYGARLARELGARWIAVDPARSVYPISGTAIRSDPHAHWEHIPRAVRPHYVRRISLFGPESTGKSTLAAALATALATIWVPEFARAYLEARGGALVRGDLDVIGEGQVALEDTLAHDANRTLVCDTDPLLSVVWAETLFGEASPGLRALAGTRRYDLTLVCDVDLPWVLDDVRYLPKDRVDFVARCEAILRAAERRYVVVRGQGDTRLAAALAAVREIT